MGLVATTDPWLQRKAEPRNRSSLSALRTVKTRSIAASRGKAAAGRASSSTISTASPSSPNRRMRFRPPDTFATMMQPLFSLGAVLLAAPRAEGT